MGIEVRKDAGATSASARPGAPKHNHKTGSLFRKLAIEGGSVNLMKQNVRGANRNLVNDTNGQ
jgi:hypothetical protein